MTQLNKGRPARGVWFLAAVALLLPWPAATQGQGFNPQDKEDLNKTGKVIAGAAGAANPAFGKIVEKFFEFGEFWVFLGQEPNEAEVFKRINQRLDALEARMTAVENGLQELRNDAFRAANLARVEKLRNRLDSVKGVAFDLSQEPQDRAVRRSLANKAKLVAERFRTDPDLWLWSDLAVEDFTWKEPGFQEFVVERAAPTVVKAGQLFPPDFKPWPTMEQYALALTIWMAAVEYAGEGNRAWVTENHGNELREHAKFLSLRPGWNPFQDAPQSLPEQVEKRVHAVYIPQRLVNDYQGKGNFEGYFDEYTTDLITREIKWVQGHTYPAREGEAGNVPAAFSLERAPSSAADQLHRTKHGTSLMWILAEKLTRLKEYGTVREQFIGTFALGPTIVPAFLYGVRPDGKMSWHRHDAARLNQAGALKVATPSGSGWEGFRQVLPGGSNVIYAVTRDGKLLWYRHNGFQNGARQEWEGAKEIGGGGWADFTHVFSGGGSGVIYAITRSGKIVWYRHAGHAAGTRAWEGGKEVGSGWGGFKHVFSGGEGIVYVVTPDGKLLWYRHLGYVDGAKAWEGPRELAGGGWADFRNVFSAGDGIIYAITGAGKLVRYRHTGHRTGARAWEPGREVATDWGGFTHALALLPGAPDAVR